MKSLSGRGGDAEVLGVDFVEAVGESARSGKWAGFTLPYT